jgi:isoleucyl-tRNA synthetase
LPNKKDSVHLENYPEANLKLLRPELEEAVKAMDVLVALGRNHREKIQVKAKIPLKKIRIIHRSAAVLENLKRFEPFFVDELNFREVLYDANEDQFVQVSAKAHFPALGKRLGPKMKAVAAGIQKLSLDEIILLEKGESLKVEGEEITLAEVEIRRSAKGDNPNLTTHQIVSIEVDPTVTPEQEREGLAREVMRKIQAARKSADFKLDDKIALELACSPTLAEAVKEHQSTLVAETLTKNFTLLSLEQTPKGFHVEELDIDGEGLKIGVTALPRG